LQQAASSLQQAAFLPSAAFLQTAPFLQQSPLGQQLLSLVSPAKLSITPNAITAKTLSMDFMIISLFIDQPVNQ
jgi:hypothetical protein